MGYSLDPISANCYPGTTVLINKLDIRDEEALNEAEAIATYINAAKLEDTPIDGAFDFEHYKSIHHFLFSDLYDWAGEVRTVDISKKGTTFTPASNVEKRAELIFKRLKERNYFKGLDHKEFVDEIVDFLLQYQCFAPIPRGEWQNTASISDATDP